MRVPRSAEEKEEGSLVALAARATDRLMHVQGVFEIQGLFRDPNRADSITLVGAGDGEASR
jgi:hypothetical protein